MLSGWLYLPLALVLALAVLYGVLAFMARPASPHPFFTREGPFPRVIAHQGGDLVWPGNTLYAFQQADRIGADILEMDVHATADGELVVIHDDTVNRTTNGSGQVRDFTLAELRALDAAYHWSLDGGASHPYRGAGLTVPTLREILEALPGGRMLLEIKQAEPSIIEPVCNMIREYGRAETVLVASFDRRVLASFRRQCPEIATSAAAAEARRFFILHLLRGWRAHHPRAQVIQLPEHTWRLRVLTPRLLRTARARYLEVHAWTMNEEAELRRMLELGVDGIVTDRPDLLLAMLGRRAVPEPTAASEP